jgi:uncharacterized membrane protein YqjE
MADGGQRPAGLVATVREMVAQALALAATRGQLAALELEDARARALRWAGYGVAAAVLLLAALLTLSLWVAAVFWDGPRGIALGLLVLVYGAGGAILLYRVHGEIAAAPPLLSLTRAELEKDRAALRARSSEADDGSD